MNIDRKEILFQKLWKSYVVIILGSVFFVPILSSIFTILLLLTTVWYLYDNPYAQERLKENKKTVIFLSSIYWIAIIGLLWTENENLRYGIATLETQLSILIFPLIFATIKVSQKDIINIIFYLTTIYFLLFGFFFLYQTFSAVENINVPLFLVELNKLAHRTYISLYLLTFGFILFIHFLNKKAKPEPLIAYTFLLFTITITLLFESRIAFLCTIILSFVSVFFIRLKQQKILLLSGVFILIIISVVFVAPNSERSMRLIKKIKIYSNNEQYERVDDRFIFWKKSTALLNQNLLIGVGTGDSSYEIFKFTTENMVSLRFTDMHNQYLDILLRYGILGFAIFIYSFIHPSILAIKSKNLYYLIFLIAIFVFFLTESILIRQMGVMFYAIFNSMFYYSITTKK